MPHELASEALGGRPRDSGSMFVVLSCLPTPSMYGIEHADEAALPAALR